MSLSIAPGLSLDPDYVAGGTFALLSKKGWGKTYTGRVLCEEFWKAQVPFVVLDPMDAWWGLRSSADGTGEGIPVAIFGGDHADAPLEPTSGALMADLVVDERLSMILSLKSFGTRKAERRFALDFLERLYRRNSELVHLLVDEADLFAPQKPQSGDAPLLGVTENIVRRGRNSGIGCTLITQRPAVLNKDVLTQVDGLVAGRIVGLQDRVAIDEWVKGHGDPEAAALVKATLASLENGEGWWWVPELGILERVQVRRARTFDSSPTRTRTAKSSAPKGFADIDMSVIGEKMAETIERAKAEDPRELRRQIRELRQQIPSGEPTEKRVEIRVEVPVFDPGDSAWLQHAAKALDGITEMLVPIGEKLAELSALAGERLERSPSPQSSPARPAPAPRLPVARPSNGDAPVVLNRRAERVILSVLAQYPGGRSKRQVAILSGYAGKGGGFNGALSKLRTAGLIEGSDPLRITEAGVALIGDQVEPLPTGRALLEHWLSQMKRAAEREALRVIYEAGLEGISKEEAAERAGYEVTGGGFNGALSKLRTLELIEGSQVLVPAEALFDE